MPDNKPLLDRYLDIKAKIAQLEEELAAMKSEVFAVVDDLAAETNEKRYTYKGFDFTVQYRTTYSYSEEVEDTTEWLKQKKRAEEKNGTAKIKSQTGFVRVAASQQPNP
jgi:hypothetical protein